jgi:putative redox protein
MKKSAHLVLDTLEPPGIRFRARTDSGLEYVLDSGDDARGPNPVDVVIAALGACTGMDVITILRKKRLVVTGYEIELLGERRDEHPRAFTRIEAIHRFRGRALPRAAVEEALRLSETTYCSVHATLAPGVALSSRIEIEEDPAPRPRE